MINEITGFSINLTCFHAILFLRHSSLQTADEFKSDIEVLKDLWYEQLSDKGLNFSVRGISTPWKGLHYG